MRETDDQDACNPDLDELARLLVDVAEAQDAQAWIIAKRKVHEKICEIKRSGDTDTFIAAVLMTQIARHPELYESRLATTPPETDQGRSTDR